MVSLALAPPEPSQPLACSTATMPPKKRAAGEEPFDERLLNAGDRDRLAAYRASYPPRALRVTRHHFGRPNKKKQEAWGL